MSVISGIDGAVNGANTIGLWSISTSADLADIIASNTKGAVMIIDGNSDWNGRYEAFGHTPASNPGADLSFAGSIDGTNGASGDAIVDEWQIAWDIEGGTPIKHTVNFSGNGTLTLGASAVTDVTTPNPPPSVGTKLNIDTADVDDVRTMTLTLRADNKEYTSSSTSGEKRRVEGPLSGTFSYALYVDDFADLPEVNDALEVKAYVDATTFWHIKWMKVEGVSDMITTLNDELVGATVNCKFTGYDSSTEGNITNPATTDLWPPA